MTILKAGLKPRRAPGEASRFTPDRLFRAVSRRARRLVAAVGQHQVLDGAHVLCPFCGTVHRNFAAWHAEGVNCLSCDAVGRERFMYAAFLDEIGRRSHRHHPVVVGDAHLRDLRVLEFSPRRSAVRRSLYERTFQSYTASDFDQSFHRTDVALDLTDDAAVGRLAGSYDVILFAHVLEHIPDYRHALRNLRRLLRPDGFVVLQVPVLEPRYVRVTWDEFHGDSTRVFHRFGFDLHDALREVFPRVRLVVGERRPRADHPEVKPDKFTGILGAAKGGVTELGERITALYGCGPLDLCDAFIVG